MFRTKIAFVTLSVMLFTGSLWFSGCQESRAHGDVRIMKPACSPVVSDGPFVYCSYCGMIPSPKGTKCSVTGGSHHFKKAEAGKPLVCGYCGAAPSPDGTKCSVTGGSHHFREY